MEPDTQVQVPVAPQKHFINRATTFSKILAAVVFITLPLVTLYIGYQQGMKVTSYSQTPSPEFSFETKESLDVPSQTEGVIEAELPVLAYDENFLSVDKETGSVPLEVTFTVKTWGMSERWIDFGDGSKENITCARMKSDTDACVELSSPVHVYTKPGTYIATYQEYRSGTNTGPIDTLGFETIVVK